MPSPPPAVVALALLVRERLAALAAETGVRPSAPDARAVATMIVAAAAPFATTSYARARLLRQLHATGLLGDGAPC